MNQSPYNAGMSVERLAEMMIGAIASIAEGDRTVSQTSPVSGSRITRSHPFHLIDASSQFIIQDTVAGLLMYHLGR